MNNSARDSRQPRKPAFRQKNLKFYEKPVVFARDKWRVFRSYSKKKQLIIVGCIAAAILIIIPIVSYLYFVRDINDPERLMNRNSTGITVTDRNDEVIYSFGRTSNEKLYRLDEISDNLEDALIASEDKDFYEHGGFSLRSIGGAVVANVLNRDATKYGGSTLTQQLVKNNLLSNSKNFLRKYQELSISIAIERAYTKQEILEMYLNSVYYGEGAFGVERAAEVYFGKIPQDLNLAESSMLVGLLPAPSAYSPISGDPELAKEQQERVLNQMLEHGFISAAQQDAALAEQLVYAEATAEDERYAHHFTDMIMAELEERYGEEQVTRSGFTVKSSLDIEAQKQAEQTIADQIARVNSLGATNAALVAIDPETGEVRALVGSADWNNEAFGQVNMATTPRQPGSSFKPIYYTEALDKRLITPSTIIRDERKTYGDYTPENYDFRFRGDITVRYALATSLNIPAIEVMQMLGVEEASETAQRMGISTVNEPEKYGLPLALGTAETRLIDMTNAYAAFANEGLQQQPTMILSIENKYGKTIYSDELESERVQSPEAAYLISSILSDEQARSGLSGSRLNLNGRPVAVKTGSTNDNVDAWTIGYTPSLVVGVWVGDNQHRPMQLGGTAAAGPIWRTTMQQMLGDAAHEQFQRPSSIIEQPFCGVNGTYQEVYIRGTEPDDHCYIPTQAEIDAQRREEEEAERRRKEQEEAQEREREREEDEREAEEPVAEEEPIEEEPTDQTGDESTQTETEDTTSDEPTTTAP